jgi:hypothetical protein
MYDPNKSLRRALYGIYFALSSAMPPESAALADDIVKDYLDAPDLEQEERHIYSVIAGADEPLPEERPHLKLVVNNTGPTNSDCRSLLTLIDNMAVA